MGIGISPRMQTSSFSTGLANEKYSADDAYTTFSLLFRRRNEEMVKLASTVEVGKYCDSPGLVMLDHSLCVFCKII